MPPSRHRRSRWPIAWLRRDPDSEKEGAEVKSANAQPQQGPPPLNQESRLCAAYGCPSGRRFLLVGLFGLRIEAVAQHADRVDADMKRRGVIPVYLIDSPDALLPLRRHQRLFEILPTPWAGHQHAPDLDWLFYARRRAALLVMKWQPIGFVAFGDTPSWLPPALSGDLRSMASP